MTSTYRPSRPVPFIASRHGNVNVSEMYDGQNKSLGPEVAQLIRKYSRWPESDERFDQVLTSIGANGDFDGKEIFSIGATMQRSVIPFDNLYFHCCQSWCEYF